MGDIEFAEAEGEWGFLSNFYIAPITVDGKEYQTTEHYFQSQKFLGKPLSYAWFLLNQM